MMGPTMNPGFFCSFHTYAHHVIAHCTIKQSRKMSVLSKNPIIDSRVLKQILM